MDGFVSCWNMGGATMMAASTLAISGPAIADLQVLGAAPNPFRDRTQLRVSLSEPSRVSLRVSDLQGRTVREIANEDMAAGSHQWMWDGRDADGRGVAPGVYLVSMAAGRTNSTRTITLIR